MTDQELLQAIREITREEIEKSEERMGRKTEQLIAESEQRTGQLIAESEQRMGRKTEQLIAESEQRTGQLIAESEERMGKKTEQLIAESEQRIMKNVAVLMDADFGPKFRVLSEQIDLILERLPDPEEIRAMDCRVSALELSVKELNREVKQLKAANE